MSERQRATAVGNRWPEPIRHSLGDAAAGVPSPGVDAEELAAHLLGVSRTRLGMTPLVEADLGEQLPGPGRQAGGADPAAAPARHRAVRPGHSWRSAPACSSRGRRPSRCWTGRSRRSPGVTAPVVVDLCTGSGAIALAISAARPDARVHAVERSPAALAWARRNIVKHIDAGGARVELRGGDIADQRLLADLDGTVDLVTANPPYVPDGTAGRTRGRRSSIPPEAVFGGPDGLAVIKPLISIAAGLLKVGGVLAIEHDDTHGETVPALLRARRVLTDVADHDDLTGRPRFVTATRVRMRPAGTRVTAADDRGPNRRTGADDDLRLLRSGGPTGRPGGGRTRRPDRATWSCCPPTPSTASAPTRSTRPPCARCWPPRAAGRTCRCRCWSAPGRPSTAW